MNSEEWQQLRRALHGPPALLAFRAVCSLLETWQGADLQQALAYADQALEAWPDARRRASWWMTAAANAGEPGVAWPLVRKAAQTAGRIGYPTLPFDFAAAGHAERITQLQLNAFGALDKAPEALRIAGQPSRWPQLAHIGSMNLKDEHLRVFFNSAVLPQLDTLGIFLDSWPAKDGVEPRLPTRLDRMRRLELRAYARRTEETLSALLSADDLPNLRTLKLHGDTYEGSPESWLPLASKPIFSQIRKLHLRDLSAPLVASILARRDVKPRALHLGISGSENPALAGTVESAWSLLHALKQAPTLTSLHTLRVARLPFGDDIVDLVERTTPGRLRRLALDRVQLTDAGLQRLARLPQLRGVTSLNLQRNRISERGVAALAGSPHLANLRHLRLGGEVGNPYYQRAEPLALGDAVVDMLCVSGLIEQLTSLSLASASLGAASLRRLAARGTPPRLRCLMLANNDFAADALMPWAESELLPSVRTLDLSQCKLGDDAAALLARMRFPELRDLRLAYNSIGAAGAACLAQAPGLAQLWRLNLHDNFIGDEGLAALAHSPFLTQLVELDVEQDVWNYRKAGFGEEAMRQLASSRTFARLDAFLAGTVDEYHGGRAWLPCSQAAISNVRESSALRAPVRHGLALMSNEYPGPDEREPLEFVYHYQTPRQCEDHRRRHDFRGIPPLPSALSPEAWQSTPDVQSIIEFLGDAATPRQYRLLACACARRVLELIPRPEYADLIALAEQHADGKLDFAPCEAAGAPVRAGADVDVEKCEHQVRFSVWNCVRENPREGAIHGASLAIHAIVAKAMADSPRGVYGDDYFPEHYAQADLARCILGPHPERPRRPFRAAWRTPAVLELAERIYHERQFADLPRLAGLLEVCGCDDVDLLAHCRHPGPHARGCWALDAILDPR